MPRNQQVQLLEEPRGGVHTYVVFEAASVLLQERRSTPPDIREIMGSLLSRGSCEPIMHIMSV